MRVAGPVWAGVIEIFCMTLTVASLVPYLLLAILASGGSLVAGLGGVGDEAQTESFAIWAGAAVLFSLVQISVQLPLAIGLFQFKRWAYGLYMWTVVPFLLVGGILHFTRPSIEELEKRVPLSISMAVTVGEFVFVALILFQVYLVFRSKDTLVN
jgi:hypothetical protein